MRDWLIELLEAVYKNPKVRCPRSDELTCEGCKYDLDDQCNISAIIADHLLANGVIVPPCKVEPIITVIRKPFHNRIEVVKNTRYEWNEAQFCFSESEADGVEARWKALAQREARR